ncbi:TPA: ankyrin repeat domain-containing protein [Enterobacter asburiae]|nr:ankyrin repeat domain-containing protein [Enterobacter asburiae]
MLLKSIVLFFLIPLLYGCGAFNDIFEKNHSLSTVSSFPEDIDELKNIWFHCEKCLNEPSCKYDDVKQCRNITLPSRDEALSKAIGRANAEAVHFLVDVAKTDVNGATGRYQNTPLIVAAYYGTKAHQDIAEFLLSRGANINKTYPAVGGTPLGVSIWKRNVNFAKFLLENGADPSITINGREEGFACEKAMSKELPELFPLIPGCCSLALHDLNFDPNIAPENIPQCKGIQKISEK